MPPARDPKGQPQRPAHPGWGGFIPKKEEPTHRVVPVKAHTRKVKSKPAPSPALGPLSGQAKPFQAQRKEAKRKTQAAEKALPKRSPSKPLRGSGHRSAGAGVHGVARAGTTHGPDLKRLLPTSQLISGARDIGTVLGLGRHIPGGKQAENAVAYLLLRPDKGLPGVVHAGGAAALKFAKDNPPSFYGTGAGPAVPTRTLLGGRPTGLGGRGSATVGGQINPKVANYLSEALIGGVDVFGQMAPALAHTVEPATRGDWRTTGNRLGQPYVDLVKDPKKAFSGKNVAGSTLLITGAYGAAGRGAGVLARGGAFGKRAEAASQTHAGVASHPHSGAEENITVSRNLATAAVQKKAIRSGAAKAKRLRDEADTLQKRDGPHDREHARDKRVEANRVDPHTITNQQSLPLTLTGVRPSRGQVNRLVDERQAFDHDLGLSSRSDVLRATDAAVREGLSPKQAPLVNLVAQGEHASRPGIERWLHVVQDHLVEMIAEDGARKAAGERPVNSAQIRKATENVELVKKALAKTKDFGPVLRAAEALSDLHNKVLEPKMEAAGVMAADHMTRPKLFTGSMRREAGYEFNDKPIATAEATAERGTRAARKAAEQGYVKAGRAVQQARRVRDQAVADARVSATKVHRTPALVKAERDLRAAETERSAAGRAVTEARVGSAGTEAAAVVRQTFAERKAARVAAKPSPVKTRPASAAEVRLTRAKQALQVAIADRNGVTPERMGSLKADIRAAEKAVATEKSSGRSVRTTPAKPAKVSPKPASVGKPTLNKVLNVGVKERQAKTRLADAQVNHAQASAALRAQRDRSRGVDPKTHDRLAKSMEALDKAREDAAVAKAQVEQAAAAHQAAKKAAVGHPKSTTPSILKNGKRVTTDEMIKDFDRIAAGGGYVKDPVHLSQAPNLKGREGRRSDFYSNPYEATVASDGVRSGSAYDKGLIDLHPEALRAGGARKAKLVNNARAFKSLVTDWAYREKGDTGSSPVMRDTYGQAEQLANNIRAETGLRYRPVAMEPFAAKSHELLAAIKDDSVLGPDHLDAVTYDRLIGAFDKNTPASKWILLPDEVATRTQAHIEALRGGALTKGVQRLNSIFRRSVLIRPSWIIGNAFEGTYRGLLTRALPVLSPEWWMLRRIYDDMGPSDARNVLQARSGSTHGEYVQRQPRRSTDQLTTTHGRVGEKIEDVATSDKVQGALHVVDRVSHAWFSSINGFVENPMRDAQFAKAAANKAGLSMRQRASGYPLIDKAFPKTYKRAVQQFLDGQVHTRDQIEVARMVDRAYGKYDKFTPLIRSGVATWTPFVAWTMNAITFLLRTMPRDHPILTSIMAASSLSSQEWLRAQGLGGGHYDGKLPGFLQGTVPGAGGAHLSAPKHYLPYGFASDPLGGVASVFAPQATGVIKALQGYDWKNKPLKNDDGSDYDMVQLLVYAMKEGGKSFTPAGVVVQFNSKGGTLPEKINRFVTGSLRYTPNSKGGSSGGGAGTTTTGGGGGWGGSSSSGSSSSGGGSGWGGSGGGSSAPVASSGWGG